MKKIISVMLLLAMMLTICSCKNDGKSGNATTEQTENNESHDSNKNDDQKPDDNAVATEMTLTEKGTVPDGVEFISGGIIAKSKDKKIQVLNQNGDSFNDKWYDDIDSIISNGICIVANVDEDGKELLGVVDSIDEKELVPCEAVEALKLSDRFLLLGYETDKAESDKDRFGFYYINSKTVNYKGYGKILDLEKGRFVPDFEIKTSKYDVYAAGNMIFVDTDVRTRDVYTAEGKLVGTYENINVYPESGIAIQYVEEGVNVYGKDLKLVSTLPPITDVTESYKPVEGSDKMLIHEFSNNNSRYYCVTDLSGNVLTKEFKRIMQVYPGGYLHITEDGKNHFVDFEGNKIASDVSSVQYVDPGYYFVKTNDDGYYVYNKAGKKINEAGMQSHSNLVTKNKDGKVIILETGEPLEAEGYAKEHIGSLVQIEDKIYDLISGKVVLDDAKSCVSTGDSLYVWDAEENTYTRYVAKFKYED